MCGIAGLISGNHADRIRAMTDIMSYRGPDDAGFYSDDIISLGQRRLSINGVSDGHQPIPNEKGEIGRAHV